MDKDGDAKLKTDKQWVTQAPTKPHGSGWEHPSVQFRVSHSK